MILFIDSTDYKSFRYSLSGSKPIQRTFPMDPHKSHDILKYLEKFIKISKAKSGEVRKIVVNKGPGSFTGTRVGVTHALALGFVWNIPVTSLSKPEFDKLLARKS